MRFTFVFLATCLEDKAVSLLLTWPPEQERWSQQPVALKRMSLCESLCIFASGLWSPWRQEKREKRRWGNTENMKDAWSFPPQCELMLRKVEREKGWKQQKLCLQQFLKDGRKKRRGGWASRFGLRSVNLCQRVTARTVSDCQQYWTSQIGWWWWGKVFSQQSLPTAELMRPVWVTVDMSDKARSQRARWVVKVRDTFLVSNSWPDRLWR